MTDASPGPAGGRPGTPGVHDRVVDLEQQAEQPGADVLSIADELTAVSGQTSAVDYAAAIGPQQAAVDLLRSFTPTGDQATRYRRDYALALNTLVSRLFDAGQKGVALTTAAAATAAYSTAGESPEADKLGLSVQLTLLVKLLSGSSTGPEALLAQQTCLDVVLLYRPSTPTDVAARDLALAHGRPNLVARLVEVGDTDTAAAGRAATSCH